MSAMINDLGFKRLRLVTYWKIGEPQEGTYDFSEFDWQMKLAEEKGVKVSLSLGLRQPRWPECHLPTWAMGKPVSEWEPQLKAYIRAIVERYKHSPALDSYQLENEYFLKVFGECPDFSRQRLVDEYNLVKSIDPDHTLVVSMSNNAIGTPIYAPTPDEWAISIYKRVWDKTLTKRYFEYPIPAWYYGFRAGWTELTRHRNSFIHELQAEAWVPDNLGTIKDVSVEEQDKSMDAARLHDRFEYGRATGMKTFDMWGVEWWYWRKQMKNDPSLWNAARQEIAKTEAMNAGK
jgi:beta-galactosidase GanA